MHRGLLEPEEVSVTSNNPRKMIDVIVRGNQKSDELLNAYHGSKYTQASDQNKIRHFFISKKINTFWIISQATSSSSLLTVIGLHN